MATYDLTAGIPSTIRTGDILNCPYSGAAITLTLPVGVYKLECWGAQGGGYSSSEGGKGGYSRGTLALTAAAAAALYAGGQGVSAASATDRSIKAGGFNGGGSSGYQRSGGGGGGSDVRVGGTALANRILVAGGGGGTAQDYSGGCGGGSTGEGGEAYGTAANGGSQTEGGTAGVQSSYSGSAGALGTGGDGYPDVTTANRTRAGGGGGGYYGGGGGCYGGGGGGSGYVDSSLSDAGTYMGDRSITAPDGTTETGHSGDGYIRITVISAVNGPDTPGNFRQTSQDYFEIGLAWDAVSGAAGYKLYRDGTLIATQSGATYTDGDVEPNGSYDYTLVAYNSDGESDAAALTAKTSEGYVIRVPEITDAAISPRTVNAGATVLITATVTETTRVLSAQPFYSGEIYSGEV